MKLNITVDLEDVYGQYNEEEHSLNEILKAEITNRIQNEFWTKFKENGFESFNKQLERKINLDKDLKVQETLNDLFENKKLKKDYYNPNELVSIKEYIENKLTEDYFNKNNSFDGMIKKHIETVAANYSKEMRERHDMLFASQIVLKLNEQGLLKEGVAQSLLSNQ